MKEVKHMKRIDNKALDSVLIAGNDGFYNSFPDLAKLPDGRLLAVWRKADRHVASFSSLLMSYGSTDGSRWSEPAVLCGEFGHMPRITVSENGKVFIIDDGAPPPVAYYAESSLFVSDDGGKSFERHTLDMGPGRVIPQAPSFAPGKILLSNGEPWACCAQIRLGSKGHKDVWTQCDMLYRTEDGGKSWYPGTVTACDFRAPVCEPSLCRMPDGRLGLSCGLPVRDGKSSAVLGTAVRVLRALPETPPQGTEPQGYPR